jgi:hypothetical protein
MIGIIAGGIVAGLITIAAIVAVILSRKRKRAAAAAAAAYSAKSIVISAPTHPPSPNENEYIVLPKIPKQEYSGGATAMHSLRTTNSFASST